MGGGFPESNREESDTNPWLALPRIMGGVNCSGAMAKTTTQNKLISLSGNISQAASEKNTNAIRKTLSI